MNAMMIILMMMTAVVIFSAVTYVCVIAKAALDNKKFDAESKKDQPTVEELLEEQMRLKKILGKMSEWNPQSGMTMAFKADKWEEIVGKKNKEQKTLDEQLKEALKNEEYEKAAELRDKINSKQTTK